MKNGKEIQALLDASASTLHQIEWKLIDVANGDLTVAELQQFVKDEHANLAVLLEPTGLVVDSGVMAKACKSCD